MSTLLFLGDSDWPGHKDGGRITVEDGMVRVARMFDHLEWHARAGDIEYDYRFNDYALVRLTALSYVAVDATNGVGMVHRTDIVRWAVLNTSGSSCAFREKEWTTCVLGTAEEVCDWLIGMASSVRDKEYLGTNHSAPCQTFLSWIDLVRPLKSGREAEVSS